MFIGIRLFSKTPLFDFVARRSIGYIVSGLLVLFSIWSLITGHLNYGIDFQGGTMIEVRMPEPADMGDLRVRLNDIGLGDVTLQTFGEEGDLLIKVEKQTSVSQQEIITLVKESLGADVEYRRVETIGPKVGAEMVSKGVEAGIWALLAMLFYVWLRFEWQFGLCAILALLHDAVLVLGLYAIGQLEFNITAIVAVLITIGYSINDTVVIYDRIRENVRKYKKGTLDSIINRSINETLSRTLLTSSSTILALLALYFFGGDVISHYSLPILVGVCVGTYSSIFLAGPMLKSLRLNVHATVEGFTEEKK